MTVKSVTLCKKLYFFHEKAQKETKQTDTNFVLLCKSRNWAIEENLFA